MNDKQLERSVQSIGKGCFTLYFSEFQDERLKSEDLIEYLMNQEGYEESGCRTRVTQARRIISSGRAADALADVVRSSRLSDDVIARARQLLAGSHP
jgi:hypothetical protein